MRKAVSCAVLAASVLGAAPPVAYQIDLARYFPSSAAEAASRAKTIEDAERFARSPVPQTATAWGRWLQTHDELLRKLERHDVYVYLRAEEDDQDTADAKADDRLGDLESGIDDRVATAARDLGADRIARLSASPWLRPYRYLLRASLARGAHLLGPSEQRTAQVVAQPVLDAAADGYKALRKSSAPVANDQSAYAALLISIVAARSGVARLRRFPGAPEASYFDKAVSPASVERALAAIRESGAYARFRAVEERAPRPAFSPQPLSLDRAIALILDAEQGMGAEYAGAYAALLDPHNARLEICGVPRCDLTGFSIGFAGTESGVYYAGYSGSVNSARALAHECGHAVHRQFMNLNQPIAAYNRGPTFMFESFAIFNELLFLNHLYATARDIKQRAYYLDSFLDDATFQVFGSAEETDLESAIYRGVDAGTVRTAGDLNALTTGILARYDPVGARAPGAELYWAKDRLFFTDPLYDVSYLYAGLLSLRYFADFEANPKVFSSRYVALLRNGFSDTPQALEKKFLGIDLANEAGLVAGAGAFIDARTAMLSELYSSGSFAQ
ncbi:MAG: hypothetical protein JOY59_08530 [Candidatus Eremiobacteraeota bacterium]|nr:hypothetical protein [Candidatus Eremiobacteraeota bacterium]